MIRIRSRNGFALVTTLWVVSLVAVIALSIGSTARQGILVSRNRVQLAKASWIAEGCANRTSALLDQFMAAQSVDERDNAWNSLDLLDLSAKVDKRCTLTVVAGERGLDINHADSTELLRLFSAAGVPELLIPVAVDAVLDWRDADDEPREQGAESEWYSFQHAPAPRNGPMTSTLELLQLRGVRELSPSVHGRILDAVSVDDERMSLSHANLVALASLPGFEPEVARTLEWMRQERERGARTGEQRAAIDLPTLMERTPWPASDSIKVHFPLLARRIAEIPSRWIVRISVPLGVGDRSESSYLLEMEVRRSGRALAVTGMRSWP